MASERVQRTIERLLDEAEDAISQSDWAVVRDRAQNVLALDHDNRDALAFVEAAHMISQFTPNLSFSHSVRTRLCSCPPPSPAP